MTDRRDGEGYISPSAFTMQRGNFMKIEIHEFYVVIHDMSVDDVKTMCNEILKIDYESFRLKKNAGTYKKLVKALGDVKESVYLQHPNYGEGCTYLNLHGSFFDNSPDFRMRKFLRFLEKYNWTPKQLDVAFNDNKRHLSKNDVIRWCNYPDDYCMGTLVSKSSPPRFERELRKTQFIKLGWPTSTINYATIYRRPKPWHWRFEIKFKDKGKILHLLENYSEKNPQQFYERSLQFLVSCIDFVIPHSKKSRTPKKQPSWQAFLGSDIKKVNWSRSVREKRNNRKEAEEVSFDKQIKGAAVRFNNTLDRLKPCYSDKKILKAFFDYTGYKFKKSQEFRL